MSLSESILDTLRIWRNTQNVNDRNFLATEPMGKLLFRMALPCVVAQIVNLLYNIVDSIYIGHIAEVGRLALTGVGICMPILIIIAAFSSLIGRGGSPKMSIAMGQGDMKKAEKILSTCFTSLLIIGVLLTIIFTIFAEDLLWLFGADSETIGYAMDYITIYIAGTIFVMVSLGLNAFITAMGYTKMGMYTVLIGAILNIILDPIFIFLFGLGVKGAALATVISQAVSAVWAMAFVMRKSTLKIKLSQMGVDMKILAPCIALGVSPFIMSCTESLVQISFNRSLLIYGGNIAVSSMTIYIKLMQFITMPIQGIAQGAQPITSFNFGAGNLDRVKSSFNALIKASLAYSLIIWAAFMLFPELFVGMFNGDADLIEHSRITMRIYFAGMGIFGIQMACQNTFLAIGNAKASLFLALLRKVILLVPLIYIMPMFVETYAQKEIAVFLAEPVADTIAVITTLTMFTISFRKVLKKGESLSQ